MIVGLSLGSILSMFLNGDVVKVYLSWANGSPFIVDSVVGVALLSIGIIGSYLLVRYQRKKDADNSKNQ